MSEIESRGAQLLAVSPQGAEKLEELRAQRKLSFPIAVDPGNRVAAEYGLRHSFPDDLREVYLSFGLDLSADNGDDSWTLPMPARFVIDRAGIIRSVAADPDYKHRPEPDEILEILDAMTD